MKSPETGRIGAFKLTNYKPNYEKTNFTNVYLYNAPSPVLLQGKC